MAKRKKRGKSIFSKRSSSKRGAIELSMTTIIVIVVGVVLLTLGLTWVRSIFTRIGGTTDEIFDLSEKVIGDLFTGTNNLLAITPDDIELDQGGTKTVGVIMANLEDDDITVKATVESLNSKDIKCYFDETGTDASKPHTLPSGMQKGVRLIIESTGNLGIKTCNVEVIGGPVGYDNSGTVIVDVKKRSGLFG